MEDNPTDGYCNIIQACEIAGVSRRTIYNWLKLGKVEWAKSAGGGTRIKKSSLLNIPRKDEAWHGNN